MAYQEGREARRAHFSLTDNPYPPTAPQYAMWRNGWIDSDAMLRALGDFQ